MSKLQIISDKNKKSFKIKNLLLKKIKSTRFKKENLIILNTYKHLNKNNDIWNYIS